MRLLIATAIVAVQALRCLAMSPGLPADAFISATAVDSQGNIYVAGGVGSDDLPVTPNAFQRTFIQAVCTTVQSNGIDVPIYCVHGFVAKIAPTGDRIVWATYLGGEFQDGVASLAIDAQGNVLAAGGTSSKSFPITAGAYQRQPGTMFVTKLTPDGSSAIFSTYFGGHDVYDSLAVIRLDQQGNIYLGGSANSTDFPTTPGAFQRGRLLGNSDAFIAKFDPTMSKLIFSTLLAGSNADVLTALQVAGDGSVYAAGYTGSPDFPRTAGAMGSISSQGFIVHLSSDASSLLYSTLVGGSRLDGVTSMAIDSRGQAYFVGYDSSSDLPVTPGAWRTKYSSSFAGSVGPDGALRYLTYLGTDYDQPGEIAVDSEGRAWITGSTMGNRPFPTTPDSAQPCAPVVDRAVVVNPFVGSLMHGFIIELNAAGSGLVYGSWLDGILTMLQPGVVLRRNSNGNLERVAASKPAAGTLTCVANAANFAAYAVAAGELVSLFGNSIGPDDPAALQLDSSGNITKILENTRVLVNGIPAPLLYVSKHQINAVVPFGAGATGQAVFQIERNGAVTSTRAAALAAAVPAFFSLDGSGWGPVAALNQDGTRNAWDNPASKGSVVSLFVTGIGAMNPVPPDGSRPAGITSKPVLPVKVMFDVDEAEIQYAGNAPTLVQGIVQINALIPETYYGQGGYISVVAGDAGSLIGPAIYIK